MELAVLPAGIGVGREAIQEALVYVDLYNALMPDAATVIGVDGLHPTEAGYQHMAEIWLEALKAAFEQPA